MVWWVVVIATGVALFVAASLLARWGTTWGSVEAERSAAMVGDGFFSGDAPAYVAMTRAIDIEVPPEAVWPWVAQTGRGAGWYSWDRLDNGGRRSARSLVPWIPEPKLGDATAIGYLRRLDPERQLSWWAPEIRYPGAVVSLAVDMLLSRNGKGSRLVIRISGDSFGPLALPVIWIFRLVDSIMAIRQLIVLRDLAENRAAGEAPPEADSEDRSRYQLYQTILRRR